MPGAHEPPQSVPHHRGGDLVQGNVKGAFGQSFAFNRKGVYSSVTHPSEAFLTVLMYL